MTIEIKENLNGSILDIGGGGEAVIGQIYKDRKRSIAVKFVDKFCCKTGGAVLQLD